MTFRLSILVAAAMTLALAGAALADDWVADKARGGVFQLVDNTWQPLPRGGIISDTRIVRTASNGHLTLTRGLETVELGPSTQISIFDKGGNMPFTTVTQLTGMVSIEAEVRNVKHFAVETPYLAAVVKGTRFTVTSNDHSSSVTVRRGHVAVEDTHNHEHVMLSVGQSAKMDMKGTAKLEASTDDNRPGIDRSDAAGSGGNGGGNGNRNASNSGNRGNGGNGNSGEPWRQRQQWR